MVKVISKFKQPYDYCFGQGDPAYVWERKHTQQILEKFSVRGISHYFHIMIESRELKDCRYISVWIGENGFLFPIRGNYSIHTAFGVSKENFVSVSDSKFSDRVRTLYEEFSKELLSKHKEFRDQIDSPVVIITNDPYFRSTLVEISPDLTKDNIYNILISHFGLSDQQIAQFIEQWFANKSVSKLKKGSKQTDIEKVVSHGFDKKVSFRHRI